MSGSARTLTVIASLAIAAFALTGCTTEEPKPTSPASAPAETPVETAVPVPSEEPEPTTTPVDVTCDDLEPAQTIYNFNPNYSLSDDWMPRAGSKAAAIVGFDGLSCQWVNQTSGEKLTVSVAELDKAELAKVSDAAAASSTSVSNFGAEGYFDIAKDLGRAEVVDAPYWVLAESDAFFEAADAEPIVESALGALQ